MSVRAGVHPANASEHRTSDALRHAPFLATEAVLLVLLAGLSLAAHNHPMPFSGDVGIERDTQRAILPHSALARALEAISTLNWPIPVVITLVIIFALFLLLRRWLDAVLVPLTALAESVSTLLISRWVHRPRPAGHGIHILQKITGTFSFPSGHVTYAFAVFGLLLFLTTQVRRRLHPLLIHGIQVVLVTLIVLMPISRILEGEHWPSDTLAGAIDGLFWAFLFAHAYLWARTRWPHLLASDER